MKLANNWHRVGAACRFQWTLSLTVSLPLCCSVQATVDFKYEHWGQRLLYAQLVLYNVWLFAFTIFTIIFQAKPRKLHNPLCSSTGCPRC